MEAYNEQPAGSKPAAFELRPFQPRTRKHLDEWVTRALAGIKVWTWGLGARIGRTWDRNVGGYVNGKHSKERHAREAQCARDVALIERRLWYRRCEQLPGSDRYRFRAALLATRRLLSGTDWWQPRRRVNTATGEVTETVYLPEDTWSAQTALAYCVAVLERLHAAVRGMAERVTPRYRPNEPQAVRRASDGPEKVGDWLARAQARWLGPPGAQPQLPATR
jgi:hypothetical protein